MKKTVIIGISAVIVLGIIIYLLSAQSFFGTNENTSPSTSTSSASESNGASNTGNSGSSSTTDNSGSNTGAASASISIKGFAFSPSQMTIKAGDSITWTNMDSAPHTVTSDSGSELNSGTLSKGLTYSHTFNSPGTFRYHCAIHPNMKANIVVT